MKQTFVTETELPYEKFLKYGPESLSESELIAIIIRTGTRNCSALNLAKKILALAQGRHKGLNCLHHLSVKELMEIQGIGEVKAIKIKCIAELAVRMASERAIATLRFDHPETVAAYYMETMRHKENENILLLLLDSKLQLINEYLISEGTVNASLLSPREVFIQALRCRACQIMLLHNHPSGNPKPSKQDIMISRKVKAAGDLLDISLVDHIIIGDGSYISMKEELLL